MAAAVAARPGQRAKRERENTCKNFFGGPSMSRILHYSLPGWCSEIQINDLEDDGCLIFWSQVTNSTLDHGAVLQNDKTWKNLTLSPKKGTRSLCRDCSWLKRGGLWRPKSQEGRENREPFVGPTNSWCSHHRRESVRVSWAQDGRCWRLVGKSALW